MGERSHFRGQPIVEREFAEFMLRRNVVRPEGPFWEEVRERNRDIPEEDLIFAMSALLDYVWSGVVQIKRDGDRDSYVDVTRKDDERISLLEKNLEHNHEEAPLAQDVGRIRGVNYVFIRDFLKKEKGEYGVYRSDEYHEFGAIPGDPDSLLLLETKRKSRNFRNLEAYRPLFSFPIGEQSTNRGDIKRLCGVAAKMRFELFLWSGITITDEEFADFIEEIVGVVSPEMVRSLRSSTQEKLACVQMIVLLRLVRDRLNGGRDKDNLADLVDIKSDHAVQLIRDFRDYPGFRIWASSMLGTDRSAKRTSVDTFDEHAEGVDRMRESEDRGQALFIDTLQQFSQADQQYLKKPEKPPSVYREMMEHLRAELYNKFDQDQKKVFDLAMSEETSRNLSGNNERYKALFASVLWDHPEIGNLFKRDVENFFPAVVSGLPCFMAMPILFSSKNIIFRGRWYQDDYLRNSNYALWKEEVEAIAISLGVPVSQYRPDSGTRDVLSVTPTDGVPIYFRYVEMGDPSGRFYCDSLSCIIGLEGEDMSELLGAMSRDGVVFNQYDQSYRERVVDLSDFESMSLPSFTKGGGNDFILVKKKV